jgi:hypothetical protein
LEQVCEGQSRTIELLVELVWTPFVGVSTRNSGLSADLGQDQASLVWLAWTMRRFTLPG